MNQQILEELHLLMSKAIMVEVEHVKAHCTGKDKREMTHFQKFVIEGNEKADELAKAGAMLDEGSWRRQEQKRFSRNEKRRTQLCSTQPAFRAWWRNRKIVKNSSRSQKKSGTSWIRKERK